MQSPLPFRPIDGHASVSLESTMILADFFLSAWQPSFVAALATLFQFVAGFCHVPISWVSWTPSVNESINGLINRIQPTQACCSESYLEALLPSAKRPIKRHLGSADQSITPSASVNTDFPKQ